MSKKTSRRNILKKAGAAAAVIGFPTILKAIELVTRGIKHERAFYID